MLSRSILRAVHAVPKTEAAFDVKSERRELPRHCPGQGTTHSQPPTNQPDGEAAARAEDAFFGDAQDNLQAFRPSLEFRGKQLFAVEQIEDRISYAQCTSELGMASREGGALLANFFEANGDVGGTAGVVEL